MRYQLRFDGTVTTDALGRALGRRFGIPQWTIYVGRLEDRPMTAEKPTVIVTPPEGGEHFGWILMGDQELAEASQLSELDLARFLAEQLNVRCLVDDGTSDPDRWILVSRDGSYGPVVVDEDAAAEGDLRIDHAQSPIAGEPELRVVPPRQY